QQKRIAASECDGYGKPLALTAGELVGSGREEGGVEYARYRTFNVCGANSMGCGNRGDAHALEQRRALHDYRDRGRLAARSPAGHLPSAEQPCECKEKGALAGP